MQILILTLFWTICLLWGIYYWYWDGSKIQASSRNAPKVVFDFNCTKQSTSSIESLEYSDGEDTTRKNLHKLKHEIKTRWPSATNMSINARSFK